MVNPAAFPSSSASFPFDIPFPPSLPSTSSLACTTRMLLRSLSYGGGGGGARGRDERREGELSRFSRGFHSLSIHPLPSPPLFSPYVWRRRRRCIKRRERDVEERREGGRRFDQVFSIFFLEKKKLKGGGGRTWSVCSRAPGDGMRGSLAS